MRAGDVPGHGRDAQGRDTGSHANRCLGAERDRTSTVDQTARALFRTDQVDPVV